jgi:hypothetical protein
MNAFHAQARSVLMQLYQLHFPEITPDILDSAGIQLNKCLLHNMDETGEIIFHFLDYAVSFHLTLNNIKILKLKPNYSNRNHISPLKN